MVSAPSLAKCQIAVYPSLLAATTPNQVPSVTFILFNIVISIFTVLLTSLSLPLSSLFFGVFHYCSVDKEPVRNLQLPYFELETTALRSCQIENSQMSSWHCGEAASADLRSFWPGLLKVKTLVLPKERLFPIPIFSANRTHSSQLWLVMAKGVEILQRTVVAPPIRLLHLLGFIQHRSFLLRCDTSSIT